MGMRYKKIINLNKGARINVSKSGASLSLGGRGCSINLNRNGIRATAGIPGTGISFSQNILGTKGNGTSNNEVYYYSNIDTNISNQTPIIKNMKDFLQQYKELLPEHYSEPMPTQDDVVRILSDEADKTVKGPFWKKKPLLNQYVVDNYEKRYQEMYNNWYKAKLSAEEQYNVEYVKTKEFLGKLIEGEETAISDYFETWLSSCEFPIDFNVAYEFDSNMKLMTIDIELPDISAIPNMKYATIGYGEVIEKKKTIAEINEEYSNYVLGLAIFMVASVFNISPRIERILISGYLKVRNKVGDIQDEYIYSMKFKRDEVEGRDISKYNPYDICLAVPNRINRTSTFIFKKIEPFGSFE